MTPQAIAEHVDRVRAGELEAYAELVRAHQHAVWRVVAFALRDLDATEDLVQQTFVQAFLQLERYDSSRSFEAWVRGIARNELRQELRRQGRTSARMERYRRYLDARLDGTERAEAYEAALQKALEHCKGELTERARMALDLRYGQGEAFASIAHRLERTVAAARQLIQRTRATLRECIQRRVVS